MCHSSGKSLIISPGHKLTALLLIVQPKLFLDHTIQSGGQSTEMCTACLKQLSLVKCNAFLKGCTLGRNSRNPTSENSSTTYDWYCEDCGVRTSTIFPKVLLQNRIAGPIFLPPLIHNRTSGQRPWMFRIENENRPSYKHEHFLTHGHLRK